MLAQHGKQGPGIGRILKTHQLMGFLADLIQLLLSCQTCNVLLGITCVYHIFQRRYADHEKFIQIGSRNTQKFQSLKQRNVLVPCLAQHSFIESQPGKFPVSVIFSFGKICLFHLLYLPFLPDYGPDTEN